MLFAKGTRVKFLHTGDEGIVTGLLDNGMVNVYIESEDMEIPAFEDALFRVEDETSKAVITGKIVQGKKEKKRQKPIRPPAETQYTILKGDGIQLAFDPIFKEDETVEKYRMHLMNDTKNETLYDISFYLAGQKRQGWNGKLPSLSSFPLGELFYDQLNDSPSFEIDCWEMTTAGKGECFHKSLKIRPKQFFKNIRTAPFLNKKVHLYRLFEKLESRDKKRPEDLISYTQRNVRPVKFQAGSLRKIKPFDSKELAEFEPEIDLHIEKLTQSERKMSHAEIMRIQLAAFDSFIEKAIRLGVRGVFVIHGIGQGRLKNEIAARLMQNPDIQTFKNEYHPRYGWGATEVIF